MHLESLGQETEAQADPLGRKFFESSVYRNVFDMVQTLETRFGRFETLVKRMLAFAAINDAKNLTKFVLGNTNIRDSGIMPALIWVGKIYGMGGRQFARHRHNVPSVNPQDISFLANDLTREVINLERELNRIHIPMPGDFRSWTDKVRNLTNRIVELKRQGDYKARQAKIEQERARAARSASVHGLDNLGAVASYPYEGLGSQTARLWVSIQEMQNWLDKIKKSIKKTELRAEELKKKQQEEAEKAYQKRLEEERKKKAAEEAVKQQKAKEKQAAEKAKQEAEKVAAETSMSDTERQQAIQQAVMQAVSAQRAEFQALVERLRAQAEQASGTADDSEKDTTEKVATNGEPDRINPAILALAAAAALVLMEGA